MAEECYIVIYYEIIETSFGLNSVSQYELTTMGPRFLMCFFCLVHVGSTGQAS